MLNELYESATSMESKNILTKTWHQQYTEVPKPKISRLRNEETPNKEDTSKTNKQTTGKPTYFVFVGTEETSLVVKRVTKFDEVQGLRKWETSNGYSFPYFNLPPLWWIDFDPKNKDKEFKQHLDKRSLSKDELKLFIELKTQNAKPWEAKHLDRVTDCFQIIAVKLRSILKKSPDQYQSIMVLIDRMAQMDSAIFYKKLQDAFIQSMLLAPNNANSYFEGAFYFGSEEPKNTISILLELADSSQFDLPVKHEKIINWVNENLLHELTSSSKNALEHKSSSIFIDAYGNGVTLSDGKLPHVNISGFTRVKLRAMNHEALCQYRYGMIDEQSFPIGGESRDKCKGALEWLTAPERKEQSWATISRATERNEILLAYPVTLPPEPPQMAMMFGGSSENEADNTARFEDCAKQVTQTLRGIMTSNPNLDIRVFLLRKMDAARTRVSSNKRCSAEHFIRAAEQWQKGCNNHPTIKIKQFGTLNKENKPEWSETETPYPMQVVWVLNTLWSHKGDLISRVKSITTDDGISLLIEDGQALSQVIDRLLYTGVNNLTGLIIAIGHAHAQGQVHTVEKHTRQALIQALFSPSILGLLLYKLNIHKEQYMKSSSYLIGRLLSLADQLHYHYCKHVREGSIPPQLMGNALMPTALEQPITALALYCNRILPYQAWAKATQDKEAIGFLHELGKIALELGNICDEDATITIAETCTDAEKAQMLLGYLACAEKSES